MVITKISRPEPKVSIRKDVYEQLMRIAVDTGRTIEDIVNRLLKEAVTEVKIIGESEV